MNQVLFTSLTKLMSAILENISIKPGSPVYLDSNNPPNLYARR